MAKLERRVFERIFFRLSIILVSLGVIITVFVGRIELKNLKNELERKTFSFGLNISGEHLDSLLKIYQVRAVKARTLQTILLLGCVFLSLFYFVQNPLNKLLYAEKISRADLSVKFPIAGGYEFAEIGKAFQRITDYLREMSEIALRIAHCDLTIEVEPRGPKDIFGNIFREMIFNLRSLVQEVRSGTNKISDACKGFTSVTDQSTSTMTQLSNSISEISKATTQVSQSAQASSLNSQQSLTAAKKGTETLRNTVNKMAIINETTNTAHDKITELGERSSQIGDIVKVITRIADQTNLLSLNAAIEAARAGEAGRGFAVVADEVRKLAEDSANSAARIAGLISEMQEKTVEGVKMIETCSKEVKKGVILTNETEKNFSEITLTVQNITNQIESVAAAAEETAAACEECSSASEEQVAGIEELSASAQGLLHTAEQLREVVAKFKV